VSDTPLYDAPSHAALRTRPPGRTSRCTPRRCLRRPAPSAPTHRAPELATEPGELPTHVAPAEDYDPSKVTTDTLAADVADEALEYPEGTPVLIPLLALPRMRRADAYEALGHISAQQKAVRTLDGEPVEAGDDASDDGAEDESDEDAARRSARSTRPPTARSTASWPTSSSTCARSPPTPRPSTPGRCASPTRPDHHVQRLPAEDPAGGSRELGRLIDEHGSALLYDLQSLGVDLRDVLRGHPRVTPRYVLTLVGQLPDTSAFAGSLRGGPEFRSWTMANSLLVATANMLYAANQQRAGKKSIKPLIKPPKKAKKRRVVRIADVLARRQRQGSELEPTQKFTQE
jgi:hypothetical protein